MSNLKPILENVMGEYLNRTQITDITIGTVINVDDLKIKIDDKLFLTKNDVILSRNLTNYEVEMIVEHKTENKSGGSSESAFASHNHDYTGTKVFKVLKELKVDDKIILIKKSGGNIYYALEKVGEIWYQ